MPHYRDETIEFDVPRDWLERTIVAYAAPARPNQEATPNLVMSRQELGPGDTLASYAERHVDQLAERMEVFEVIDYQEREIGGRPAVSLRVFTENQSGSFAQVLSMIELPGRVVAALTLTAPEQDAAAMEPLFERILSTVKIAPPEGSQPA